MRPDGQEGLTMDHTCRAVFILEEDHSIPAGHNPLMLEAILHRPIMERAVVQCLADGVQRFFVVCSPRFADEAAACFPEGTVFITTGRWPAGGSSASRAKYAASEVCRLIMA